jgi:hypothetical protein
MRFRALYHAAPKATHLSAASRSERLDARCATTT